MHNANKAKVATIGTFDGIHNGHREVINTVLELARKHHLAPVAFVFVSHPLNVISPQKVPEQLMNFADKKNRLETMGLSVFPINFTPDLRRLTSGEYMKILHDTYGVKVLVVGHDNHFGSNREASFEDYVHDGYKFGIEVVKASQLPGISSSIIRRLLQKGDVKQAAYSLGYLYTITGKIVHGQAIGNTIGFPTANLLPDNHQKLIPANGVYAAYVLLSDGSRHKAMVNIGVRPTVTGTKSMHRLIEAHLIGYKGDLYNTTITLEFVERMRDERKMNSLEELKLNLTNDLEKALTIL